MTSCCSNEVQTLRSLASSSFSLTACIMWVAASPSATIPFVLGEVMVSMDSRADLMNNLKLDRKINNNTLIFNAAHKFSRTLAIEQRGVVDGW